MTTVVLLPPSPCPWRPPPPPPPAVWSPAASGPQWRPGAAQCSRSGWADKGGRNVARVSHRLRLLLCFYNLRFTIFTISTTLRSTICHHHDGPCAPDFVCVTPTTGSARRAAAATYNLQTPHAPHPYATVALQLTPLSDVTLPAALNANQLTIRLCSGCVADRTAAWRWVLLHSNTTHVGLAPSPVPTLYLH